MIYIPERDEECSRPSHMGVSLGISSVVITNKTVLFTCLLQFKFNMAVKFHLCLLLIILVGIGAHVAFAGKHSIYSVLSKESTAHLCVDCRQRKNSHLIGAFDFTHSLS